MSGSDIWVFLEREDDKIEEVSLEILSEARRLADKHGHKVTGIILGNELGDMGKMAVSYGADRVVFLRNRKLETYGTELFTKALSDIVLKEKPDTLLVGGTRNGRDLAARVAARLRTGLAANVVTLDIDDAGTLYSGVPGYGSKVIASIVCIKNKPQMSTVRAGVFSKGTPSVERKGEVKIHDIVLDGIENSVSVISRVSQEMKDITNSEKVVVVGNGVSRDTKLVEQLANTLQADIGVTRPIADKGLFPREVQIGSTGISLKAKYALILGSSGSKHFVTGIENCKTVISIDTNPDSDIFDYSDYCVVGDASKIVSEIIKRMEVVH